MAGNATPKLKNFARQLLACEAAAPGNPGPAKPAAGFRSLEKLRGPLGKLIGIHGFFSLLSRALALGGAEAPDLRALQVNADGSLAGSDRLNRVATKPGSRKVAEVAEVAEVILMAHLIGLLVTFIGPALTLNLLRGIWPKLDDPDLGDGEAP